MNKTTARSLLLAVPVFAVLTGGCGGSYNGFYQSGLHTTSEPYHVIPLRSDSLKSASYVSGGISEGGANEDVSDNVLALTGAYYRSHNFGYFQGYYGANASLGSYEVRRHPYVTSGFVNNAAINSAAGGKLSGGYGLSGGVDFVLPIFQGSEWRVLGLSFNWQNEFGAYSRFRKGLPDSAADAIFNKNQVGMAGISTEFAFRLRHGMLGYKIMFARDILNGRSSYKGVDISDIPLTYFGQTLSLTHNRLTGSFQCNVGYYTVNMQLGLACGLGQQHRHSSQNR